MTPAEFNDALASIGWSERFLARELGCNHKLVQRWVAGQAPIPPSVGRWLARIAYCHDRYPPPDDWRVYTHE